MKRFFRYLWRLIRRRPPIETGLFMTWTAYDEKGQVAGMAVFFRDRLPVFCGSETAMQTALSRVKSELNKADLFRPTDAQ